MLRKFLKIGTLISLCIIAVELAALIYTIQLVHQNIHGSSEGIDQVPLLMLSKEESILIDSLDSPPVFDHLSEEFDPIQFDAPPIDYRPWTRWWIPGNNVDRLELIREVHLFKEAGFGGLEIYPTSAGIPQDEIQEVGKGVYEFHTPGFYHNLSTIINEASKRGMKTDLLLGSGTPTGGAHVSLIDNIQTLAFGEAYVLGDKLIELDLPLPRLPGSYYLAEFGDETYSHPSGSNWIQFYPERQELVALFATKYRSGNRSTPSLDLNDRLQLDPDSTFLITDYVTEAQKLSWEAPKGYWKLIAIYSIPNGEKTLHTTEGKAGFVLDPFDSLKVIAHHDWYLQSSPAVTQYFGRGLRAIFHDHFSYHSDRHYASGLIQDFQRDHGYDVLPYLPLLLQPGQDHFLIQQEEWQTSPEFSLSQWDDRIQYDYSLTISNRFIRDHLQTSQAWAKDHHLAARVQPYGLNIDIIKAASIVQIPEAEQWYAGGSELFLKLISSGGIWANKTLISAETGKHENLAGAMFPLRLKIAANKLFSSGFNHLVLHGSPYQLEIGSDKNNIWNPFGPSEARKTNYSSNFSESSPFWEYQDELNAYLARCQFILRQGKPTVDVMIYYPFLGFPHSFAYSENHKELYFNGEIEGFPTPNKNRLSEFPYSALHRTKDPRNIWLKKVWPIIQSLDEAGISWAWVNDELLSEVKMQDDGLHLRDFSNQMILVPFVPHIQIKAAENLVRVSRKGGKVIVLGNPPDHQPGFSNREENDQMIQRYFEELSIHSKITEPKDLENFLIGYPIKQAISFEGKLPYLRKTHRTTDEGNVWTFVHNTLKDDRFASLRSFENFDHYYWFNPQSGHIHPANFSNDGQLKIMLGPYEGMFLYAKNGTPLPDSILKTIPIEKRDYWTSPLSNSHELIRWDLIVPSSEEKLHSLNFQDTLLRDWRELDLLKHSDAEGLYLHHLIVGDTLANTEYILDLGYAVATIDVQVNTFPVASLCQPPYRVNLTGHLLPGDNVIEIWVTPLAGNSWIGKGQAGDSDYHSYKKAYSKLNPAGLLGPVFLWEIEQSVIVEE